MKKIQTFISIHETLVTFLIGLGLTCALLWPLFKADYFTMHDDVQLIRLYEMNTCIQDHQIPCRWDPNLGGEYGYPLFNYYGPLPYYVGEIFYLITHSLIVSAKLMFTFAFVGSFCFMFLCARKLWGNWGGVFSAVFYSYAPYHAMDFYVRGAMGEMWALMLYPAIIWAILQLKDKPNVKNMSLFGLFFALLIMSHNLSAMIFLPVIIGFVLVLFFSESKSFRQMFTSLKTFFTASFKSNTLTQVKFARWSVVAIIVGLCLASFYWLPSYFEKSLAHVETTVEGYFGYTEHFKGLKKLFLDHSWGYGASEREYPGGPPDGLSYQIGFIHELIWALAILLGILAWKKYRSYSLIILFLTVVALASVFMIHPRSLIVWQTIDQLKYLQFPWRFLMFIIFTVSLMAGGVIYLSEKLGVHKKLVGILWIVFIVTVVGTNFGYFIPNKFVTETETQAMSGQNWVTQIDRSIFDYLPIYAKLPPAHLATNRYEILSGQAKISNYKSGSDWQTFDINVKSLARVQLSNYYFPDWKVLIDSKPVEINYHNPLGLITFLVDPGKHYVDSRLYDTPIRSFGNYLSLIVGLIILFVLLYQWSRFRRSVRYILRSFIDR